MGKALLKAAKYPLAASLLLLVVPFVPSPALGGVVQAAPTHFCYYYKYWKESGNEVTCYGSGGADCAVCAS